MTDPLAKLQRLHADILARLDEMDVLTAEAAPPMDRLPPVRLALTRASRARTLLLEDVYDRLLARADLAQREALGALKLSGKSNMVTSVQHIGRWTLREIVKRWADYCIASNILRRQMRARVAAEAALVYPLLALDPGSGAA